MSAQINQLEGLTGGLLMACLIGAENGRARAVARQQQRQDIIAHNMSVARARAARRREAAMVAQQVAVGQGRMSRWLDRVSH